MHLFPDQTGQSASCTHPLYSALCLSQTGARLLGVRQFLPATAAIKAAGEIFCSDGSLTQSLCTSLISALSGRNDAQMNKVRNHNGSGRSHGGRLDCRLVTDELATEFRDLCDHTGCVQ